MPEIFAVSGGAIFIVIVCAAFPALIIVAVVVKLWEVRQAKTWPSTAGKVVISTVASHKQNPGVFGYDFSDTEVTNEPRVEYVYSVAGKKYRGQRITIGEKTSGFELEEILARYPVGAGVTVYYDPTKPDKAVLERDLPWGILTAGLGCLLLFFIGGPLIAAFCYFRGVDWIKPYLANPDRAPFVAALSGLGLLTLLFSLGYLRYVWQAAKWPVTRGRILASGTEAFLPRHDVTSRSGLRTHYKPSVIYAYEVNGHQYQGDRLTIGAIVSATFSGMAKRTAAKYPVGAEVDVHYNPQNPGESVLRPYSWLQLLPPVISAGLLAFAWAVGTGRVG